MLKIGAEWFTRVRFAFYLRYFTSRTTWVWPSISRPPLLPLLENVLLEFRFPGCTVSLPNFLLCQEVCKFWGISRGAALVTGCPDNLIQYYVYYRYHSSLKKQSNASVSSYSIYKLVSIYLSYRVQWVLILQPHTVIGLIFMLIAMDPFSNMPERLLTSNICI